MSIDRSLKMIREGAKYIVIAENHGMVEVTSNADKGWVANILDAVRGGLPGVQDKPGAQVKIVEVN